jgi:hypothetical protein
MRTTVRFDEHLLAEAKKHAAESGKTLAAVLEDALRASLARRGAQAKSKPLVDGYEGVKISRCECK